MPHCRVQLSSGRFCLPIQARLLPFGACVLVAHREQTVSVAKARPLLTMRLFPARSERPLPIPQGRRHSCAHLSPPHRGLRGLWFQHDSSCRKVKRPLRPSLRLRPVTYCCHAASLVILTSVPGTVVSTHGEPLAPSLANTRGIQENAGCSRDAHCPSSSVVACCLPDGRPPSRRHWTRPRAAPLPRPYVRSSGSSR